MKKLLIAFVCLCATLAMAALNNNTATEDGRFVIEPGAVTVDGHRLATTTELATVRAELTNLVAATSNRGEAIRMELTNLTAIAQATADAALPKSGGVMTGDLLLGGHRLYFGSTTNSPWAIGLGETNIMFGAGTNIFVLTWGVPPGIYVSNVSELTNALASATNSDVIWVSSGTYTFTAPMEDDHETYGDSCLLIPTNVTVRSISGVRSSVILDANSIGRVARLEDASSMIIGVTITNGVVDEIGEEELAGGGIYGGTISNCLVISNYARLGGGASHCSVYNSTITKNYAASGSAGGGGINAGSVYNSIVSNNIALFSGGGIRLSSAYNCLILDNSATGGGGAGGETLCNCTISGNSAISLGGGVWDATLSNCISWANNSVDDFSSGGSESYSCGSGYTGAGSITSDPLFIGSGDYRLQAGSPCINTGTNGAWTAGARDLDGNQRIWPNAGIVDMGAYEYDSEPEYP